MNCILLGGSNSVLMNSVRLGLSEVYTVKNYALGATSCMQNLTELLKRRQEVEAADIIFTESNVNDIMTYVGLDMNRERIKFIIDEYYRILFNTNKPVYVIILPTHPEQEKEEDILFINNLHVENCIKFGFKYVCFDSVMSVLNKEQIDFLLPHPRHFNEAFVYQMTYNLARVTKEEINKSFREIVKDRLFKQYIDGYEHIYMPANELVGEFSEISKSNSAFSAELINLNGSAKFKEHYYGYKITAIHAWCDDYSGVVISNNERKVIKTFIKHYTTTEIKEPISINETTSVCINSDNIPVTEVSLLAKYDKSKDVKELKIEGFTLFRGKSNNSDFKVPLTEQEIKDLNISHIVLPKWQPYAAASKSYSTYSSSRKVG